MRPCIKPWHSSSIPLSFPPQLCLCITSHNAIYCGGLFQRICVAAAETPPPSPAPELLTHKQAEQSYGNSSLPGCGLRSPSGVGLTPELISGARLDVLQHGLCPSCFLFWAAW